MKTLVVRRKFLASISNFCQVAELARPPKPSITFPASARCDQRLTGLPHALATSVLHGSLLAALPSAPRAALWIPPLAGPAWRNWSLAVVLACLSVSFSLALGWLGVLEASAGVGAGSLLRRAPWRRACRHCCVGGPCWSLSLWPFASGRFWRLSSDGRPRAPSLGPHLVASPSGDASLYVADASRPITRSLGAPSKEINVHWDLDGGVFPFEYPFL